MIPPIKQHTAGRVDSQFQIMMNNQKRIDLASNPDGLSLFELHEADKELELQNAKLSLNAKIHEKLEEEYANWLKKAKPIDLGIMDLYASSSDA